MESVSTEIRDKAHRVCADYLGGVWKTISPNEIIIEKIIGGYVSLTLKISLPSNFKSIKGEPTQIIMKNKSDAHVLGEGAFGHMTENIIAVILSEKNLAPKVYGVFDGGRLDEFIKSRPLVNMDYHNPKILSAIVKRLAHLHSLTLPISKDPNRMFNLTKEFMKNAINDPRNEQDDAKRKIVVNLLLSINPEEELKWLHETIDTLDSQIVYTHGDLQKNNILLQEDSLDDPIIHIIDLDICGYNYRGYDLANLVNSFCLIVPYSEPPYIKYDWDLYPTTEELKFIFGVYLEEFQKIKRITLDIEKEEKMLMKEIKVFSLLQFLLGSSFSIMEKGDAIISTNKLNWLELADIFLTRYKVVKKELIENYFH